MRAHVLAALLAGLVTGVVACGDAGPSPGGAENEGAAPPDPPAFEGGAPIPGSSAGPDGGAEATGGIGAQITLPAGQTVAVISWSITGPAGASTPVQRGTVNVQNSLVASFYVGNLLAAQGYGIALSATTVDGSITCMGSAQFGIVARQTTQVGIAMGCNLAPSAVADAGTFNCATVNSVAVVPDETTVGSSVSVSSTVSGPVPSALTYSWTASSGSFNNPASATPVFTCAVPGTATLTLTAADGPVPVGSSCDSALDTRSIAVTCDPVVASSVPALPPWGMALLGLSMAGAGCLAARRRRGSPPVTPA